MNPPWGQKLPQPRRPVPEHRHPLALLPECRNLRYRKNLVGSRHMIAHNRRPRTLCSGNWADTAPRRLRRHCTQGRCRKSRRHRHSRCRRTLFLHNWRCMTGRRQTGRTSYRPGMCHNSPRNRHHRSPCSGRQECSPRLRGTHRFLSRNSRRDTGHNLRRSHRGRTLCSSSWVRSNARPRCTPAPGDRSRS